MRVYKLINKIMWQHKAWGNAYHVNSDLVIDYSGRMVNSGALRYIRDLIWHSDLVSEEDIKELNEFSKQYAIKKIEKEKGMFHEFI